MSKRNIFCGRFLKLWFDPLHWITTYFQTGWRILLLSSRTFVHHLSPRALQNILLHFRDFSRSVHGLRTRAKTSCITVILICVVFIFICSQKRETNDTLLQRFTSNESYKNIQFHFNENSAVFFMLGDGYRWWLVQNRDVYKH